jgi:hypothetical protein
MTAPKTALLVPERLDAADREALTAANPGVFLVMAQGPIPTEEPKANRHTWLTVINVVKTIWSVGKTAAIFSGPLGILAAAVVNEGIEEAEQAILQAPEVEDWTPTRIAEAKAAVKGPTT